MCVSAAFVAKTVPLLVACAQAAGSDNPPFAWRPVVDNSTAHFGLPAVYSFDFINTTALAL